MKGGTAGSSRAGDDGPVTCTAANTEVTVTKVTRPINHLLLTATNTGTGTCFAYGAPFLRFDEGHSAVRIAEDSAPQAVVTLAPGESAYAGIGTWTPDGDHEYTARTLSLLFADRDGNSTGVRAKPALPAGGVVINSSAWVGHWHSTAADALVW
ncbi:DUF4232 domain-containing protein [Streptomyces sp. TRM43335]|uniref:DUF4232 domain-containing protein n=1 Tax=Streptomyces taklimakanensis TaxID=2569853 RepID=A0A6G2B9K1_9ACTN|nr:DUF4232 domain-containing protein [Streptomyces taklimakanensis]